MILKNSQVTIYQWIETFFCSVTNVYAYLRMKVWSPFQLQITAFVRDRMLRNLINTVLWNCETSSHMNWKPWKQGFLNLLWSRNRALFKVKQITIWNMTVRQKQHLKESPINDKKLWRTSKKLAFPSFPIISNYF